MKVVAILMLIYLLTSCINEATGYKVCGNNTQKAEVDKSVKQIVKRLMTVRNPSWGWDMWSTAIVLQVAAPKMFFARQKSIFAFKRLVGTGWDEMSFFDKCEAAFVARALCLNPNRLIGKQRNMLNEINNELGRFTQNTTALSANDFVDFNFGLSALCINGYSIDASPVNKLLDMQNPDGSFGQGPESYLVTVWLLRPIYCLSRMKGQNFNTTRVNESVLKIRDYVIKSLNNATGQLRFGQFDFSSHDALVGLWKSKPANENASRWYCNEVMEAVGVAPQMNEDEEDLNRRLLTVTGTDYLDLQDKDYKCLSKDELDKRPKGYKPTCNYENPETCGLPPPEN